MQTVYVVVRNQHYANHVAVEGVFDTEAKANYYVDTADANTELEIQEFVLNTNSRLN